MKEIGRSPFNPEKYGMMFCPFCEGASRAPDHEAAEYICSACGGFGWMRRENRFQPESKGTSLRYGAPSY
jgi:hypothetical protein